MSALHIFLKVANVLTYLFLLSGTIYTTVGPTPDDEVVLAHLSYLTPAAWIQWVWVVVHALLGGFIIYQWFEPAQDLTVRGVGWHFVIPSLLNGIFLGFWAKGHLLLAWFTILITASSVSYVFYNLERNYPAQTLFDKIFIHAPFSLWHGWIIFLTVVSTFATFTTVQETGPNVLHIVLVEIGLFFLASTAVGYTEFKKSKGDVLGALVIALGLYAIFAEQSSPVIHWSALGFALFTTIYPSRPYIFRLLGYGVSEETAPLLG